MTYPRRYVSCVLCLGAGALAAGCGLISSDVTNVDLTLPDKTFTVDASSWQVNQQAADTYLGMSCTNPAPNICTSAAAAACTMNCTGSCDAMTSKCDLALNVSVYKGVDLQMDQPELATINNEPVITVSVDSVQYAITDNSLNVATPPLTVFVAPMSVMDPSDPSALAIGTIDAIPAMTPLTTHTDITFTATGKQALINIMGTYKNPFNVIVGATLMIQAGDPIPSGKLDAVVYIKAHAGT